MARRSIRLRSGRTVARETEWLGFAPQQNTFTGAGGTILGSLNTAALALRPFTVIRQYFELMIHSDQSAALEVQICGFGTCVVSNQASTLGVTAVPTPITDISSDLWMLHQLVFGREDSQVDLAHPATHYSIESKAMRKVNGDQDFIVVGELSGAGNGFVLTNGGRVLVKLH